MIYKVIYVQAEIKLVYTGKRLYNLFIKKKKAYLPQSSCNINKFDYVANTWIAATKNILIYFFFMFLYVTNCR